MSDAAAPGRGRGRGRDANDVVVILWRDIPAQVNGQRGRERRQILLPDKFQRAIDRAKRKAGIYTAHEDIAQWTRVTSAVEGDAFDAAERRAEELDAQYSTAYLGRLAYAGGLISSLASDPTAPEQLAALEELDENGDDA